MEFTIHTLGESVETTTDKTEANWTLGSRYGGVVFNRAVLNRAIVFKDNYAKVNPIEVDKIAQEVRAERVKKGLRL